MEAERGKKSAEGSTGWKRNITDEPLSNVYTVSWFLTSVVWLAGFIGIIELVKRVISWLL